MKKSGLILSLLLACLYRSPAQVTVEVTLDQEEFLPGEVLPVVARITNRSGETLRLGGEADWLMFVVEAEGGRLVHRTGDVPVVEPFTLESSMRAIKRVDIAPYFSLLKPGRYSIVAQVRLKDWNRQISSQRKSFNIIEGANLWEQEVGVPRPAGATNEVPEVRKYALQQANYLRSHLMLYLRLTDGVGKLNKVLRIGPMLSFGQPQPQVDKVSNLHVLYQNGPHSFSYTVIDPNGNIIGRQSYEYTSRPRLQADPDGNFAVVGGQRRLSSDDIPPTNLVETNAPPSAP